MGGPSYCITTSTDTKYPNANVLLVRIGTTSTRRPVHVISAYTPHRLSAARFPCAAIGARSQFAAARQALERVTPSAAPPKTTSQFAAARQVPSTPTGVSGPPESRSLPHRARPFCCRRWRTPAPGVSPSLRGLPRYQECPRSSRLPEPPSSRKQRRRHVKRYVECKLQHSMRSSE